MSAGTRVLPSLTLLSLRAEATANEYSRHLIEHQCQERRWCSDRDELDYAADNAAFSLGHARAVAILGAERMGAQWL